MCNGVNTFIIYIKIYLNASYVLYIPCLHNASKYRQY